LAPRETYYGYGNYGPNSVNLINVNINTIVVKNRNKNVYVTNGVTAVHRDTFVRGRHVDFKVNDNPFLKEKIHIGRPDIKPERETRMAVIRDIPKAKEPPKKIREIKVRELKEARPMIRERDKSVFSPDKPHKQMKVQTVEAPRERKRDRLEERPKDRDKKFKGSERQQLEDKKKEIAPAEKRGPDEKNGRQQDRQGSTRKEKESGAGNITPAVQPSQKKKQRQFEQQDQKAVQPKQEVKQPERPVKRESTAPQGLPEQPNVRQRDREPVQDRQMQKEERQQKKPDKQDVRQDKEKEKQEKKEKSKKVQDQKDGAKPSEEGTQQRPVGNGTPAPR